MSERLPWFKCEPSKLLGALGAMDPQEGYIYTIVILRIYETGGPISDSAKVLARRTGMRIDNVTRALASLVEMGKITIENGVIDCEKTKERLAEMNAVQLKRISAGKTSAAVRWGKSQLNQTRSVTSVEHVNDTRIHNKNKKDNLLGLSTLAQKSFARLAEPFLPSDALAALNKKTSGVG